MTKTTPSDFSPQTSDLRLQTSDFRPQTSFLLKIFLKIFVKISSRKAIPIKILPKSEVLERIFSRDVR